MESATIALGLHTAEELVLYSNIGHWVIGGLLLAVSAIALLQALGYLRGGRARYLWPGILLVTGLSLPAATFIHHAGELALALRALGADMQQLQHLVMTSLLGLAGLAEIAYVRGRARLRFVFPAVLAVIGTLFLVHPQHGTSDAVMQAAMIHRYLGATIVLAAIFRLAEVLKRNAYPWLAFPWILFAVIAALLLISYREPPGAYVSETAGGSQDVGVVLASRYRSAR